MGAQSDVQGHNEAGTFGIAREIHLFHCRTHRTGLGYL